jgi:Domain of unknown function (DUF4397)
MPCTLFLKGGDIIGLQAVYDSLSQCIGYQASIVRIFDTVPGLVLSLQVDEAPIFQNLTYNQLTNYIPTVPGVRHIRIYNAQTNSLLLEIPNFEVPAGQILTGALYGGTNSLKFEAIIDDVNEDIDPDQSKVRFYNLDSIPVTISLNPSIGFTSRDLASGEGTEYYEISPGEYNFQISTSNQRPRSIKIRFNPGRIYTLYITSSVNPDSQDYALANISQIVLVVDGNTLYDKCN